MCGRYMIFCLFICNTARNCMIQVYIHVHVCMYVYNTSGVVSLWYRMTSYITANYLVSGVSPLADLYIYIYIYIYVTRSGHCTYHDVTNGMCALIF